ncbi:FtsX-like permease family protein [Streptomyces sp. NPDC051561]|uniref:FtsX-like permease family protein n=1 Tax=Streptomyces sp. NPDC051561 TaxID=3365658 RepID=UPI0037BBE7C2
MSNGLARASVRFRPASFVGSFVALLLGAAVITACAALLQTGILARIIPERYAHAPVVVAAEPYTSITVDRGQEQETISSPLPERARVDGELAARIAARPGVASVVWDQSFPVRADARAGADAQVRADARVRPDAQVRPDASTRSTGGDTSAPAPSSLSANSASAAGPPVAGRTPAAGEVLLSQQVAREARLKIGDRISLATPAGGTDVYRVSGLAAPSALGTGVWFDAVEAGRLSGHPGKADALLVTPRKGVGADTLAAQVKQAVGDKAQVLTGDDRGMAELPALAAGKTYLIGLGGSFGGIAAMTAIFVVMGTIALAVTQRAREFALLRAIGATPKQIRRTIATEAMMLAPAAGLLGAIPGYALANWWFGELLTRGAVPPQLTLTTGPLPIAAAVLLSTLAALGAGRAAARRPANLRPGQALGEASLTPPGPGKVRIGFGVAFCAGGVSLAAVASQLSGDAAATTALGVVMCFLTGVALLGPLIARAATRVLGLPLRAAGAPGSLAADNSAANARRLASAITPLVMVIAFCGTLVFMQTSIREASARNVETAVTADHVLTPADPTGPGLPAETAARAAALPGVRSATGILRTGVVHESMENLVTATTLGISGNPAHLPEVLDLDVRTGSLAALGTARDTVALDASLADNLDVTLGDRVPLRLGDGTHVHPKLIATYSRGLGVGQVLMPRAALVAHVTAPYDSQVLVAAKPGTQNAALTDQLKALTPAATVTDAAGYGVQADLAQELGAWANTVMAAVLGGFAAISAANTLVMTVLDRRREVGLLRLSGTTRRQVKGMMRWEALLVAATGLVLGAAIAWTTLLPIARGITGAAPYIPPAIAVPLGAGAVLLTLMATGLPTRALLRVRPLEAGAGKE